ncbi:Aste57867_23023 [Aphanomyces stellatus]|uniref:Aste57867_23023 protein n=1 Tax=Aphanomyces stellatus TaxID=120398 RepID=A0A485LNH6_9STRA|nr:hypothetical protein As57867_022952 [Aphanomyces stellatus]VFT99671.1 Aste57867_23023 [Aphanomyces stellatus]
MKRTRRIDDATRAAKKTVDLAVRALPPDVLSLVGFYLPDTTSFFNYLEAIQGSKAQLGSLQYFWDLATMSTATTTRADWWPPVCLHVTDASQLDKYSAIVHLFDAVFIAGVYDLRWITRVLHAMPRRTLRMGCFPRATDVSMPLPAWFKGLASLPITDLTWSSPPWHAIADASSIDAVTTLLPILSELPRLHVLNLDRIVLHADGQTPALEDVLTVVDTLPHLTSLSLGAPHILESTDALLLPRDADVVRLARWLDTTALVHLSLARWSFDQTSDDMAQFLRVVLRHPTLETLQVPSCPGFLRNMTREMYFLDPCRLTTLNLFDCGVHDRTIRWLILVLPAAISLVHLRLGGNPLGLRGVRELMQLLHRDNAVRTLDLTDVREADGAPIHGDDLCAAIAPSLAYTKITTLDVSRNNITDVGAKLLASVFLLKHMERVWLTRNNIGRDGALELVFAAATHSLPARLHLEKNPVEQDEEISIAHFPTVALTYDADAACHDWYHAPSLVSTSVGSA